MARRNKPINLPAPYLRRVWLDQTLVTDREAYPFCLPFLAKGFELSFDHAITIIVGENGTGKSTLLEGIAALAGYDEAGGGKGYMPVDHSDAIEVIGRRPFAGAARELAAQGHQGLVLPRREFFLGRALSRRRSETAVGPDFLSHSHGEGFLRFFEERCQRQGIYIFDEPELALSPNAPDRIPEAAAADGREQPLPGDHGHALADADGLSRRDAAAACRNTGWSR